MKVQGKPRLETGLERGLFAARWLMAPMYVGLAGALALVMMVFCRELYSYALKGPGLSVEEAILAILTLIDLTLAANLILIVIFSGYENFVSKLDIADTEDRPSWMGTVGFSGLKMKLIASIVAISGIHLLKQFMAIGDTANRPLDETKFFWLVVVHLSFVASGVLLALMDLLSSKADRH